MASNMQKKHSLVTKPCCFIQQIFSEVIIIQIPLHAREQKLLLELIVDCLHLAFYNIRLLSFLKYILVTMSHVKTWMKKSL